MVLILYSVSFMANFTACILFAKITSDAGCSYSNLHHENTHSWNQLPGMAAQTVKDNVDGQRRYFDRAHHGRSLLGC